MDMPVNRFKQRLRSGEAQIGLWLGLADAYCAELAANAGFDWLLIDGEHAPNDLRGMLAQLQAVAPYASQAVIRPVIGDTALIKQVLDIGAQTLLVPMVESAAQARQLVQAMHYPATSTRLMRKCVCWCRSRTRKGWPTWMRSWRSRVSMVCSSARPT